MGEDATAKRIKLEGESSRQDLPLGGGEDGCPDLISRLPDGVLGDIISLLPTRDGARTQAISRRWRPLWRAAPLNLAVGCSLSGQERKRILFATKILSDHTGPGRRFALLGFRSHNYFAKIDGLLSSRALTGLREIELSYDGYEMKNPQLPHPMPPSALRFAPTLCVAKFANCDFPSEMVPGLNFPHLKKLSLYSVTISEDALHSLLFGCSVLESLLLEYIVGIGRLRISSKTLRSIDFRAGWKNSVPIKIQELVLEDAPCLESLVMLHPQQGLMPPSALRFAPTLCGAKFACSDFPGEMVPELNFPPSQEAFSLPYHNIGGCPSQPALWLHRSGEPLAGVYYRHWSPAH